MSCKDVKKWLIKHQPVPPKGNAIRRLTTLSCLICAIVRAERASLKSLGKEMGGNTDLESRIKKAKRWLNNKWTDTETHFSPYVAPVIRSLSRTGELVLAIDGSVMGNGCMCLMVSVLWRKRAVPVCWVVRQAPKGHFPTDMHTDVVGEVAGLLESLSAGGCRVVMLGDGEFDSPELQEACLGHGWDYVLRANKATLVSESPGMEGATKLGSLAPLDGGCRLFVKGYYITAEGFGPVNIVYWHDKRYKKPLYLLTNLEYGPEAERFYRKRYIIETLFADLKSRGFNMGRTRISNPTAISNLLIVAAVAYIKVLLFEFDARRSPHLGKFCRKDRVGELSVFQLGLQGLLYYIKNGLKVSFQFSKNFPEFQLE